MLSDSVLGTLYFRWLQSRIFSFLHAVFRPFSTAFKNSAIIRFIERDSVVERSYRNSLFAKIVRAPHKLPAASAAEVL